MEAPAQTNRLEEHLDPTPAAEATSASFVGRWNHLVSTTNWEKGRIIFQWRDALVADGAPAAEYADEAWARLVGGVTGQHVGRLRRVYQRFAQSYEQFAGLYWSHFQAALDWDDAEMWLEGAVSSSWSVTQMRNQRWETLGAVEVDRPREDEVIVTELDEDFEPAQSADPMTVTPTQEAVQDAAARQGSADDDHDDSADHDDESSAATDAESEEESVEFVRPFAQLGELPEDLAEAFESFKLAILRHKTAGWAEINRDDVLASLDALKELALAPSPEAAF